MRGWGEGVGPGVREAWPVVMGGGGGGWGGGGGAGRWGVPGPPPQVVACRAKPTGRIEGGEIGRAHV